MVSHATPCPKCHGPSFDGECCALCVGRSLLADESERVVAGYRITGELGRGGAGVVFRAEDPELRREVALKFISAGPAAGEAERDRFRAEAEMAARLDHPNIVPVYEVGEADGVDFFCMKLAEGGTLAQRLADFHPPRDGGQRVAGLLEKIARAVHHAHERGVLHRDLKPGNILLDEKGEPLVADFGLARRIEHAPGEMTLCSTLGTPAYMAPEQAQGGKTPTTSADVYSLGAILYELLTGRPPLVGDSATAVLALLGSGEGPPRVRAVAPRADRDHATICERCLESSPERRYASAAALADDLARWRRGEPILARRVGRAERLVKWARRQPALAGTLMVAMALAGVGVVLGSKAIVEGRRAEHALAELRKTAPALRQLAASEASFQRFDSALEKIDAALALDPEDLAGHWQRAWLLMGSEDFSGAAAAIQRAVALDPAHREWAEILPVVQQLAATPEGERWTAERAAAIHRHLQAVGAESVILALSSRLALAAEEKAKLVRNRLDAWLGTGRGSVTVTSIGLIEVRDLGTDLESLEPLRALPINLLTIDECKVADLTPLSGMPLLRLRINRTGVTSLEPLTRMPLQELHASHCEITDWSVLHGKSLRVFHAPSTSLSDLSFLQGAPLEEVGLAFTSVVDLSALRGAPLKSLDVGHTDVATLNPLQGMPLERLDIRGTPISDLQPLRGAPLRFLNVALSRVADLAAVSSAPMRELITDGSLVADFGGLLRVDSLQRLRVGIDRRGLEILKPHRGLRAISCGGTTAPFQAVEEFWPAYEAIVASEKAVAAQTLERLIAAHGKRLADGTLELDCADQKLHDLSLLKGLNLSVLRMDRNPITDLTPLAGMPLRFLGLRGTQVSDLSPLRGMPLVEIHLYGSNVADLSPLRGLPLERVFCDGIPVKDLSPLLDLPNLRDTNIPRAAGNIGVLRAHPKLEHIGWEKEWVGHPDTGHSPHTAAAFWARWDSLNAAR